MQNTAIQPRRVYGRRHKPLGKTRKEALSSLSDYEIRLNDIAHGTFDPRSIKKTKTVHLEIGSGTGEHLVHLAVQYPDDLFLTAEPFIAGTANLIKQVTDSDIKNIRTYPDDGMALLQALQPQSVDHAYVLFPDPWPKKRHAMRRFIQKATVDELARVIRPGGELLLATDDPGMLNWMLSHMMPRQDFNWINQSLADCAVPLPGHIHSRYAKKAIAEQKSLYYLLFMRAQGVCAARPKHL